MDILHKILIGTKFVQCRELKGEHTLTPGGAFVARFTDKWSALYVETSDEGGDWEHVYSETGPDDRKRRKAPKMIHTWSADHYLKVHAPVPPTDPDRVTIHGDPWGLVSGIEATLGWASQWAKEVEEDDEEQEDANVAMEWGYAASFGKGDGFVARTTGDLIPEGMHARSTLKILDMFMGFIAEVAEPAAENQSVPHGDPKAVRYLHWTTPFTICLRVEVPSEEVAVTLQFLRQKEADPRIALVEQGWADPAALVTVGARAARGATGVPGDDERDKPVTLFATGGGFSIRSGRRKPLNAETNGEGEVTVSNRLVADALYWFLDSAVEITIPKGVEAPMLISGVNRDECIMLLQW